MKCFDFISDRIWEELNDAETYIEKAIEFKETHRQFSEVLSQLSQQELSHASTLRAHLMKMTDAGGHELWKHITEWMLPKFSAKEEKVRRMHEIYRG